MLQKTTGVEQGSKTLQRKPLNWERLKLSLIIIPFFILIILFRYVPIAGWSFAFVKYRPGMNILQCDWMGLENFATIFQNWKKIAEVLRNTLVMSGLNIAFSPVPIIFAIFLSEARGNRFKKVVQTVTTIPHFVSWIIIYALAFAIFSTEGVLNTILMGSGLADKPANLLSNNSVTWIFQALLQVWKTFGWNAIIYFAAISGIDSALYEAASIDGAGRLQKIWYITIPGIANTYFTLLLLNISNILNQGLDQYLAFYNSAVANKLTVLDLYTYRLGMVSGNYSYSTAVGILKTIISLILLFSANAASKKIRGYTIV